MQRASQQGSAHCGVGLCCNSCDDSLPVYGVQMVSPLIAAINHDVAFLQKWPQTLNGSIDWRSCLDKEHHTPAYGNTSY